MQVAHMKYQGRGPLGEPIVEKYLSTFFPMGMLQAKRYCDHLYKKQEQVIVKWTAGRDVMSFSLFQPPKILCKFELF